MRSPFGFSFLSIWRWMARSAAAASSAPFRNAVKYEDRIASFTETSKFM
jgi:hypothetical protein